MNRSRLTTSTTQSNLQTMTKISSFGTPIQTFLNFKRITFIDFFLYNNLDLPPVFNTSKSLYRLNTIFWFLKYNTLLMRRGLKEKIMISSSLNFFVRNLVPLNFMSKPLHFNRQTSKISQQINNDRILFSDMNFHIDNQRNLIIPKTKEAEFAIFNLFRKYNTQSTITIELTLTNKNQTSTLEVNSPLFVDQKETLQSQNLWNLIWTLNPLFDFFIFKTPKLIWKYSRGKAGKFFIVWKFIPPFKRSNRILRWIGAATRFEPEFKMITKGTNDSLLNDQKLITFILSRKKFIHNYIFREAKFSSMKTFRSLK